MFYFAALERECGQQARSGSRKQLQEFKALTGGNSRHMRQILLGHRLFSDAHRKMTCVKLSAVWTEFRIVLQGDLFLSNKEHTHFPSILWGWGRRSSWTVWGWAMCLGTGWWDWRCLGVLLIPRFSGKLPGKKEEAGQA